MNISVRIMTEPFVDSETDRTKSKWVAQAFKEFGRQKTTVRSLFYFVMKRGGSNYPICGKLVGEIRICRPYIESDGEKLPKWVDRARKLGYVLEDAILDEIPGEHVFIPKEAPSNDNRPRIELWINKSSLNQIILPTCFKNGATLVSVSGRPSKEAVKSLIQRSDKATIVLCLSDLSVSNFAFCRDMANMIAEEEASVGLDIRVKKIGLMPPQVIDLRLPLVQGEKGLKEDRRKYETYLKPHDSMKRKMAELDALEAYYPGGLSGFVNEALSKYSWQVDLDDDLWLLNLKKDVQPTEEMSIS
jgi:hypothetical protein